MKALLLVTLFYFASAQDAQEQECFRLLNQHRANNGLRPLIYDAALGNAAERYSKTMADNNHFSHTGPDGSSPSQRAQAAGFRSYPSNYCICDRSCRNCQTHLACTNRYTCCDRDSAYTHENIAAGRGTGAEVHQQWVNSPGHNRNMLTADLTHVACRLYYNPNSRYRYYWTQLFGRKFESVCNTRRGIDSFNSYPDQNEPVEMEVVEDEQGARSDSVTVEIKKLIGRDNNPAGLYYGKVINNAPNDVDDWDVVLTFTTETSENPLKKLWGLDGEISDCQSFGESEFRCRFSRPTWFFTKFRNLEAHIFGFVSESEPTAWAENVLEDIGEDQEIA